MKNFFNSLALILGAFIVFTPLIIIGLPMSLVVFWLDEDKSLMGFLKYLLGIILGVFNAIGYILKSFAIGYDILANAIGGQALEFTITKERETLLGSGEYTISAAIGDIGRRKAFLPNGKRLDKALNWAFNEENHSEYALRQEELIKEFRSSIPKQR